MSHHLIYDADAAKALEVLHLTPDVVAHRGRVLDLLAPAPGERVLDIGVGPGFLASDIARLVGPVGAVVGLDLSPAMVAAASVRLSELPQATVLEGDAVKLAFADASFDAVVSTQVYEYIADMPSALHELRRVLKAGGRALILDTDWRSIVWHSSNPARMDRFLTCWDAHLSDPHLPARLRPLLKTAGFQVRHVEILPMLSYQWQSESYAASMMGAIHSFLRSNRSRFGLSDEDISAWRADQQTLIEHDEFFFSLNRFAFLATC